VTGGGDYISRSSVGPKFKGYVRGFDLRKNVGSDHLKGGGEPHAWSSESSTSFSSITSILAGNLGFGNSSSVVNVLVSEQML